LPANFQPGRQANKHVAIGDVHEVPRSRAENDLPDDLDDPEGSEPDEAVMAQVSTHRRRSSDDIDQEFDNMLTTSNPEGSHLDQKPTNKKGREAWERKPRRSETYADGVVRMQKNQEKLNDAVKEKFGDIFTDQEIKDGATQKADVDMSVHRVQAKIVALRSMRQDFLDVGDIAPDARMAEDDRENEARTLCRRSTSPFSRIEGDWLRCAAAVGVRLLFAMFLY